MGSKIKQIDRSDEPHIVADLICAACGKQWVLVCHHTVAPAYVECHHCGSTTRKILRPVPDSEAARQQLRPLGAVVSFPGTMA